MSEISVFRRHRGFFWALLLAISLSLITRLEWVNFETIPYKAVITIFLGVIAGVGTMMIIFQKYDNVIGRAKDKNMKSLIDAVFKYPLAAAAIGLIYTIVLMFVQLDLENALPQEMDLILPVISIAVLLFLLFYSVLSLAEGISFVYRVMVGES